MRDDPLARMPAFPLTVCRLSVGSDIVFGVLSDAILMRD